MFRRTFVLIPLMALALCVQARDQSPGSASHSGDGRSSDSRSDTSSRSDSQRNVSQDSTPGMRTDADTASTLAEQMRQRRRDILREAVRVQSDESPGGMRQLSLQERIELRQQLRQQQQDWLK